MSACEGLLGLPEEEVVKRLGVPTARRKAGPDTWLMFRSAELGLRLRLSGSDPARVASWTASFETGFSTLAEAARAVGVWPAAAPDEEAAAAAVPLVRRVLPCPRTGETGSLTATVRHGRFTAVSAFDEAPDWL